MNAVCEGFQWIGQDFAHCDRCGRSIDDHEGMEVAARGAGPFSGEREIISFDEFCRRSPIFEHYFTGGR